MIRGTTPRLEFSLPFETDLISALYVTFAQDDKVVIEKTFDDCIIETDRIIVDLSQSDTLAFEHEKNVEIQIRVRTVKGEALASNIIRSSVSKILKDGEI